MKNSLKWPSAWHEWLSFSAFTLAGIAFEGARFGTVVSLAATHPEAEKCSGAEALKHEAGAQR